MFTVHDLSKSYGLNSVFKQVTFTLNQGQRAALVGPNGCGKSTLMNIIAGDEPADSGHVAYLPPSLRIGYLRQGLVFDEDETLGAYLGRFAPNLEETLATLESVCAELVQTPDDSELNARYEATLQCLDRAQQMEGSRKDILAGFQLLEIPQETPIHALSGGQKVRLGLAGVLLDTPQVLLLDEPTNHLDLEMRAWLQEWILSYPGGILLVSHDRAFLDAVIHKVIAFPPAGDGIREYPGNYSDYVDAREREYALAMTAFLDQQDEVQRLKKSARKVRDQARPHKGGKADGKNTDGFSVGHFANRALETVRRAKNLEKRIAFLEDEGALEKPRQLWDMRMLFDEVPESGQIVLKLERLVIGYEGKAILPPITQTVTAHQRIALVGPNGVGKTSLFKTLLGEIPPVSGGVSLGTHVNPGYLSQEQVNLNPAKTVLEILQALPGMGNHTEARSFLHKFLFSGDEVFQRVSTLSYGQRSRLMLALLVAKNCNLLLLDEPLNHLDLPSQEAFETALSGFNGTILAIAHDRYFIDRFAQVIWRFAPEGIESELTRGLVADQMG